MMDDGNYLEAADLPQGEAAVLRAVLNGARPQVIERHVPLSEGGPSRACGYLLAVASWASVASRAAVKASLALWTRRVGGGDNHHAVSPDHWRCSHDMLDQLLALGDSVLMTEESDCNRASPSELAMFSLLEGQAICVWTINEGKDFVLKASANWGCGSGDSLPFDCCLGRVKAAPGAIAAMYRRAAWVLQLNAPEEAASRLGWGGERVGVAALARARLRGADLSVAKRPVGRRIDGELRLGEGSNVTAEIDGTVMAQEIFGWREGDFGASEGAMVPGLEDRLRHLQDDLACLAWAGSVAP